jgi:hypothetical protein
LASSAEFGVISSETSRPSRLKKPFSWPTQKAQFEAPANATTLSGAASVCAWLGAIDARAPPSARPVPGLTTVRIGHAEMGRAAAQLLLAEVGERRRACITQLTTAGLIVRASTARLR